MLRVLTVTAVDLGVDLVVATRAHAEQLLPRQVGRSDDRGPLALKPAAAIRAWSMLQLPLRHALNCNDDM